MLGARLAEARAKIDDAGNEHQIRRIQGAIRLEAVGHRADTLHAAIGDEDILHGVDPVTRVHDTGAVDAHAHQPSSRSAAA